MEYIICVVQGVLLLTLLEATPDWESDWIPIESQLGEDSYRVLSHGLGELPLKVKVLLKSPNGSNSDFVFEASTQQEVDDDPNTLYCGVVYFYDQQSVFIYAPTMGNKWASGRLFCTGNGWSDGFVEHDEVSATGMVKAMAWRAVSFSDPSLTVDWTEIGINHTFVEIPLDKSVNYVHLQVRCAVNATYFIYAEGTSRGSSNSIEQANSFHSGAGGVVYAFSSNAVRVWIHGVLETDAICLVEDGYGSSATKMNCNSGHFRLFGFETLGPVLLQHTIQLSNATIQNTDMLKLITQVQLPTAESDIYHAVQVTALSGPNAGFTFTSTGQIHRTPIAGYPYGGLAFGYSSSELRLFVPVGAGGSLVVVGDHWGDGSLSTYSNHVNVTVTSWRITSGQSIPAVISETAECLA